MGKLINIYEGGSDTNLVSYIDVDDIVGIDGSSFDRASGNYKLEITLRGSVGGGGLFIWVLGGIDSLRSRTISLKFSIHEFLNEFQSDLYNMYSGKKRKRKFKEKYPNKNYEKDWVKVIEEAKRTTLEEREKFLKKLMDAKGLVE